MNFSKLRPTLILALAVVFLSVMDAYPCSLTHDVSSTEMVKNADAIVRATAVEYVKPPRRFFPVWTSGEPDTTVRFKVLEVIRGTMPSELILPGYLGDSDDFNDHVPPYRFVRPGGRHGSCYANTYRVGAQFLLILQKKTSGEFTVNWYGLGPVNEQLHSSSDPWLLWVREQAKKQPVPIR
jgi:hypothetical protein